MGQESITENEGLGEVTEGIEVLVAMADTQLGSVSARNHFPE